MLISNFITYCIQIQATQFFWIAFCFIRMNGAMTLLTLNACTMLVTAECATKWLCGSVTSLSICKGCVVSLIHQAWPHDVLCLFVDNVRIAEVLNLTNVWSQTVKFFVRLIICNRKCLTERVKFGFSFVFMHDFNNYIQVAIYRTSRGEWVELYRRKFHWRTTVNMLHYIIKYSNKLIIIMIIINQNCQIK